MQYTATKCTREHTFVRWILGLLASADKCKVVASKEHLDMPDSTLEKLCQPNTTSVNFTGTQSQQLMLYEMISWFTFSILGL